MQMIGEITKHYDTNGNLVSVTDPATQAATQAAAATNNDVTMFFSVVVLVGLLLVVVFIARGITRINEDIE